MLLSKESTNKDEQLKTQMLVSFQDYESKGTEKLMPIANPDPSINLDTYEFKENEVLFYMLVYNKAAGLYSGLTKKLA